MKDAQTDPVIRDYIATQVRMELARSRISVREAARRLGWGQTVLYRRSVGEREFEASELAQVARLLGVPIGDFFPADLHLQVSGGRQLPEYMTPGNQLTEYMTLAAA